MATSHRQTRSIAGASTSVIAYSERFYLASSRRKLLRTLHVTPELITLKAKGKSPKDASPLLARAGDHRYEIEACLELNNAEASAGLVIYYNKDMHFGLGFRPGELLRYRRGAIHTSQPKTEITVNDWKMPLMGTLTQL